jgi:hypothetical protein
MSTLATQSLTDLKGTLVVRQANLLKEAREKHQRVVLIEADLLKARREAAEVSGALEELALAIAAVDSAPTVQAQKQPKA